EPPAAPRAESPLHRGQEVGYRRGGGLHLRLREGGDEGLVLAGELRVLRQRGGERRRLLLVELLVQRGAEQAARFVRGHGIPCCRARKRSCRAMRARCNLLFTVPIGKPVICLISS